MLKLILMLVPQAQPYMFELEWTEEVPRRVVHQFNAVTPGRGRQWIEFVSVQGYGVLSERWVGM